MVKNFKYNLLSGPKGNKQVKTKTFESERKLVPILEYLDFFRSRGTRCSGCVVFAREGKRIHHSLAGFIGDNFSSIFAGVLGCVSAHCQFDEAFTECELKADNEIIAKSVHLILHNLLLSNPLLLNKNAKKKQIDF